MRVRHPSRAVLAEQGVAPVPPSDATDSRATSVGLLSRVRSGQSTGWNGLVHIYSPLVYEWARRMGLQPNDAGDVVQEVFLAVYKNIDRFKRESRDGSFRGWLWTITRSKVNNTFRAQGKQPKAAGGTSAQARMADLPNEEPASNQRSMFSRCATSSKSARTPFMRGLDLIRDEFKPRTWQAFWRVVVDEVPATKVADELGASVNAVRLAKFRVLKRLREELAELVETNK